jgi:hypothetical protein
MKKKQLTTEEAMQRKVSLHLLPDGNRSYLIASDNNLGERTLEMAVAEIQELDPDDDDFADALETEMSSICDLAHDVPVSLLDQFSIDDWRDPDTHFKYCIFS